MVVECSRSKNHPKAESRQEALKKGWYQDENAQWVCPKCQRGLEGRALKIEPQQPQKRIVRKQKGRTQRVRAPMVTLGGDLVV
jgi:hypothetical protein